MLEKDPINRKDACILLNHAWFVNMKSRDDEGKFKFNYFGTPTLNTIEENSEKESIDNPYNNNNSNFNNNTCCLNNNNNNALGGDDFCEIEDIVKKC